MTHLPRHSQEESRFPETGPVPFASSTSLNPQFRDWFRVGMGILVRLCPPQHSWHQGAGGDCHTKERACLLKNDPNSEGLVPQR